LTNIVLVPKYIPVNIQDSKTGLFADGTNMLILTCIFTYIPWIH